MIRTSTLAALLAAPAALSTLPARATLEHTDVTSLAWPDQYPGTFKKVDSATLFDDSTDERAPALLVLAGSDLVLVRDPLSKPEHFLVASQVSDFCVLPPQNGVSRVAISTQAGLLLSQVIDANSNPALSFTTVALNGDTWKLVNGLDAVRSGDKTMLVAISGTTISRAEISSNGAVTALSSLSIGVAPIGIAVGETDPAQPGPEIACILPTNQFVCCRWDGVQILSYTHPLPLVLVARNPGGTDDLSDSFCFDAKWDYGGGYIGEALIEYRAGAFSTPIGGPIQIAHIDFASAGADVQSDCVLSSSTTTDLVVLHGTLPGASLPFELRLSPEFNFVPLTTATFAWPPEHPFVAADDFDLDGDGDVAMVGTSAGARGIWILRGNVHQYTPVTVLDSFVGHIGDIETFVDIQATLNVQVPSNWGTAQAGETDKVRVRVWIQPDVHSIVSSTVASPARRFLIASNTATVTDWSIEVPTGAESAIFHFELMPMRVRDADGVVLHQGPATYAAASVLGTVYNEFMCEYPDEWNPPTLLCNGHDEAPIVTTINRRTIIKPTSIQDLPH